MKNKVILVILIIGSFFKINNVKAFPTGYQQVEYIKSTGAAYANTGYNDINNYAVYRIRFGATNGARQLIGNDGSATAIHYWGMNASGLFESGASYTIAGTDLTQLSIVTIKHTTTAIEAIVNGTSMSRTGTYAASTITSGRGVTSYMPTNGIYIYGIEVFDATTNNLVASLVPCRNTSTNVGGLCNVANNDFFGNVGTGSFELGGDVPNTGIDLNPTYLAIITLSICLVYVIAKNKKEKSI